MSTNARLLRRNPKTVGSIGSRPGVAGKNPAGAKKKQLTRRSWLAVLIRMGIMLLIILWLILVVWAVPVSG